MKIEIEKNTIGIEAMVKECLGGNGVLDTKDFIVESTVPSAQVPWENYRPASGMHSLHDKLNGNGVRTVNFAVSDNITIKVYISLKIIFFNEHESINWIHEKLNRSCHGE